MSPPPVSTSPETFAINASMAASLISGASNTGTAPAPSTARM
jgi:hypothetical protein